MSGIYKYYAGIRLHYYAGAAAPQESSKSCTHQHQYARLTRSTSSAFVSTSTSANVTVHSVSADASMLTRVAGTFVDVWNKKELYVLRVHNLFILNDQYLN